SISPDILCTSKGLTGGTIPLAVTLVTDAIFRAHYSEDRKKTFFHSSSYTANPIACAAALANVEIWRDEPVAERITALSARQAAGFRRFRDNANFTDSRAVGTILALDLRAGSAGYLAEINVLVVSFMAYRSP
ncbi:aminotransferase class III-fold pyridoxal phosphate-dependent enzyme, partial [Mesorhizobium sp. M0615]|uniref:aminotransferase class III-fold pyridoxal phosphate-dependent enzyme n=1 Tax=Mesorhizobium sp. M0615 TaxID=2956971 RepID=UPI003336AA6C